MDKGIEMKGGGLKCDNPNCDWFDMSIPSKDYKKWINKPCPKCGSNLLTEKDYKTLRLLTNLVRIVNFIYFFIPKKWLNKKLKQKYGDFDENERVHQSVQFDGSGKAYFGKMEKVEKEDVSR